MTYSNRAADEPVVVVGFLGWSNMRGGTEFYSEQNDENGRWVERRVGGDNAQQWGDLLVDELAEYGANEGCELIVVAVPRFVDPKRDRLLPYIFEAIENATADAMEEA